MLNTWHFTVDEEYSVHVESAQEVEHSLVGQKQGKQVSFLCTHIDD